MAFFAPSTPRPVSPSVLPPVTARKQFPQPYPAFSADPRTDHGHQGPDFLSRRSEGRYPIQCRTLSTSQSNGHTNTTLIESVLKALMSGLPSHL